MQRRRSPRPLAVSLGALRSRWEPTSELARVQSVWEPALGAELAAHAEPVALREGVLAVRCESSVWAAELDLMASELALRLNGALDGEVVRALRCRAV
jgi:predicted nucleic acid-binding Zn ribbon protein